MDETDRRVSVILRMPERLRRKAKVATAQDGTTLQAVLLSLLKRWLRSRKAA